MKHRILAAVAATGLVLTVGGAGSAAAAPAGRDVTAKKLLKVSDVHPQTGMTLLEGPVFTEDGSLLVVDVTAPAGQPKVIRIDTATRKASPFFTDQAGAYTSAQVSPHDGRIYLTDFVSGAIVSIAADGTDPQTFFTGDVDGSAMKPDDLAFDEQGNLYISDTTGHDDPGGQDRGRVVRIDRDGQSATVVAGGLPAPNGISFDEDFGGLWVSQYTANRIDYIGLAEDGTTVTSQHPAMYVNAGRAQVDSNAVDAAGNVYQMFHNQARVMVFSPEGDHLATVEAPVPDDGKYSATNLAIRPGKKDAYLTVSGPSGGFVYRFEALAQGIRQSNGG
ncbi:SMP-30/gluconolactonase/LRE family protein [Kineosporia babensis]|uniref:SMP-30/gluconolactonase/LRE family protein n=1 Tax=Kineosporia babensis TaxID=499548 RepID=A0A9X1NDN1_9ACTN|nr:SMP-30/gluconolactonase/LRE family protein [Kineosporia babensis]MCD5311865.1 SMP-30/gluconolactonase/LRE family protein [Kineosporia babensis]